MKEFLLACLGIGSILGSIIAVVLTVIAKVNICPDCPKYGDRYIEDKKKKDENNG